MLLAQHFQDNPSSGLGSPGPGADIGIVGSGDEDKGPLMYCGSEVAGMLKFEKLLRLSGVLFTGLKFKIGFFDSAMDLRKPPKLFSISFSFLKARCLI